jgi:membrane protease YdiL (CAAX protease family)
MMETPAATTFPAAAANAKRRLAFLTGAFVLAIALTEVVYAFVAPTAGIACAAVAILALLGVATLEPARGVGEGSDHGLWALDVLPVLALVPLLRIVSLTIPVRDLPQLYWYAVTGAPLLVALALTAGFFGVTWSRETFGFAWSRTQGLIGLAGVPVGLIAYLVLRPDRIEPRLTPALVAAGLLILIPFNALMEEVLFRGALQRVLVDVFGDLGVAVAAIVFMATYLGTRSAPYVVLVGIIGFAFGRCVRQTGSLAGVVVSHGLISLGLLLVWPYVLG